MKSEQIIFVSAAGWQSFTADGSVVKLPAWPRLKEPALVLVDFPDAVVGLQSCKGKTQFAAAQIEKTLRDQGAIDGESHVLLHRQLVRGDMNQVFYTAVPSGIWQEFQAWADQQADHCLLMALAALLPIQARAAEVAVLRSGQQLLAYTERDGRLRYAAAMAFGDQPEDFRIPAASLLSQLQLEKAEDGKKQPLNWASVWTVKEQSEPALVKALELPDAIQSKVLAQRSYSHGGLEMGRSALPELLSRVPARALAARPLARLAWLTDRSLPLLSAAIAAIAVCFGVGAWWMQSQLGAEQRVLADLQSQLQGFQAQVSAARDSAQPVQNNEDSIQLARKIGYAERYNPMQMLNILKEEAGDTIRIQRLQLTRENASNPARFRVDGVVEHSAPERLSQFLAALQARGWQAQSEAPFDGAIGAFAYYLQVQEPSAMAAAESGAEGRAAGSAGRLARP